MTNTRVRVERSPSTGHWLAGFEAALADGRFREAADTFDRESGKRAPLPVTLLAARARLYADPQRALDALLRVSARDKPVDAQQAALLAEGFARTGNFRSADVHLKRALSIAKASGDPDALARVGYYHIRRFVLDRGPAKAREFLSVARSGLSEMSASYALYAESLILEAEERVLEQASVLVQLLRSLPGAGMEFHEIRASATRSLAGLARELYLPDAVTEVERQLASLPWAPDFAQAAFVSLEALGWTKVVQGDYFNGFRHLKQASTLTDSAAWKVVAASNRSYLARRFGEHRWSRVELDEAEYLAKSVDWRAASEEERMGLLLMAELFSDIDAGRAAMYLARYRELGAVTAPAGRHGDARLSALVQLSSGVVEVALRNRKNGLADLRKARVTFERFGYDFRAARCLVEEYRATGNGDLLAMATVKLRNYGHSWLATELRALGEGPGGVTLPRAQKLVFDEVCTGKTTHEIATTLGRSQFTINNHLKEIFRAFGVTNRASLLAEAARRGILDPK